MPRPAASPRASSLFGTPPSLRHAALPNPRRLPRRGTLSSPVRSRPTSCPHVSRTHCTSHDAGEMGGARWDQCGLSSAATGTHTQPMLRRAGLISVVLMLLSTTTASAATTTVKMVNHYFTPKAVTVTLGNSVRWKNVSTKRHSATPTNNWSWAGVTVSAGATSPVVAPTQAGAFPYFCSFHPTLMKGTVKVRMRVSPLAGNTGTYFTLTLGTVTTPGVLVHQVEARLNGGAWQLRATTSAPTISIFFPTPGNWDLRTRLRYQLGGATS